MTQMDLFTKQKQTYIGNKHAYQRGRGVGEGWIRRLGEQVQTIACKTNKHQYGPNVEHRELYSESCNKS